MDYPLRVPAMAAPSRFAHFLQRRNRFVVEIELLPDRTFTTASMPNPGRMQELLLPGAILGISPGPADGRHPWRVQTLHRDDALIPLDTVAANKTARFLLDQQLIPGLEDRRVLRAEVTPPNGGSRFDFEVTRGEASGGATGEPSYLEVKSCTLFNGPWALFPDAVTDRGRRHVEELAHYPGSVVLFLVHSGEVKYFSPDVHVDPMFSRTLYTYRDAVRIVPVALDWGRDAALQRSPTVLPVPWERIAPTLEDRGSYLILMHLRREQTITVGALGPRAFPAGYYIYVGSAMQHLSKRVARHASRRRRRTHWHIDYFREHAEYLTSYAIREPRRREEEIGAAIYSVSDGSIPGFGSSDSAQPSHLFHFHGDPRTDHQFQELVLTLRRDVFH